jgi:uncharacterized phage protein (TIGR01671 family)
MREILFRGKQVISDEWVEGFLVIAEDVFKPDNEKTCFIIEADASYFGFGEFSGAERVDPETVGQFTGLTDKNGKKIFEDDIVKIQIGNIIKYGAVFYGERAARIGIKDSTGEANFSFMQQPLIKQYQIIVIGNIFDNPELLKEGEIE